MARRWRRSLPRQDTRGVGRDDGRGCAGRCAWSAFPCFARLPFALLIWASRKGATTELPRTGANRRLRVGRARCGQPTRYIARTTRCPSWRSGMPGRSSPAPWSAAGPALDCFAGSPAGLPFAPAAGLDWPPRSRDASSANGAAPKLKSAHVRFGKPGAQRERGGLKEEGHCESDGGHADYSRPHPGDVRIGPGGTEKRRTPETPSLARVERAQGCDRLRWERLGGGAAARAAPPLAAAQVVDVSAIARLGDGRPSFRP
jgi:hypothetical protein